MYKHTHTHTHTQPEPKEPSSKDKDAHDTTQARLSTPPPPEVITTTTHTHTGGGEDATGQGEGTLNSFLPGTGPSPPPTPSSPLSLLAGRFVSMACPPYAPPPPPHTHTPAAGARGGGQDQGTRRSFLPGTGPSPPPHPFLPALSPGRPLRMACPPHVPPPLPHTHTPAARGGGHDQGTRRSFLPAESQARVPHPPPNPFLPALSPPRPLCLQGVSPSRNPPPLPHTHTHQQPERLSHPPSPTPPRRMGPARVADRCASSSRSTLSSHRSEGGRRRPSRRQHVTRRPLLWTGRVKNQVRAYWLC